MTLICKPTKSYLRQRDHRSLTIQSNQEWGREQKRIGADTKEQCEALFQMRTTQGLGGGGEGESKRMDEEIKGKTKPPFGQQRQKGGGAWPCRAGFQARCCSTADPQPSVVQL